MEKIGLVRTRDGKSFLVPFILITSLFFLWGVAHSILDVLNKHFQDTLEITRTRSALYNPQIQISAESETKRSIFREKDKTKRSKKESAQHSKSRNKSFVMTSVSAL